MTEEAARAEFRRRAAARLAGGYELLEGALPNDPRARDVTKRGR